MRVFKFGGTSIQDEKSVRNIAQVLEKVGYKDVLIVISAMGKMTNAFEKITNAYLNNTAELSLLILDVKQYHKNITSSLFKNNRHPIFSEIEELFASMEDFMKHNKFTDYNYVYDQIVSTAEIISTKIMSAYLNKCHITNTWVDVRDYIKTDSNYREAKVNWKLTEQNITLNLDAHNVYITQGFIAGGTKGETTTLGREGSDYSAGIFAYCLNAESLTIWKDVDGVLNADPRYFKETLLLQQISYTEAIEMAFYGASVIHPKTLQPLQKKEIPLYVKSFVDPLNNGTVITRGVRIIPKTPCYIVKKNQILLSISAKDFSFIVEENISEIFSLLHKHQLKVNLIQNSAIHFFLCLEDKYNHLDTLVNTLKNKFTINYHKNISLYTIRHFDKNSIHEIENTNKVLLKHFNKETVQIVIQ